MAKKQKKSSIEKSSIENVLEEQVEAEKNPTMGRRLRNYLLAGILVTAPISITIYLTYVFLKFTDSTVAHMLPADLYEELYVKTTLPGIGLVIALVFFVVMGWLATNILGRMLIRISEFFVNRMPIIRTLYNATKQIFETVMASKSNAFREPVMLEYPRRGVWSIGFVTGRTKGEVQRITEEDTINVFVPTTPNPTSGYLLFVPKNELKYLDMSIEEAVKLVVSAGIISPPDPIDGDVQKQDQVKNKVKAKAKD